jgi:uncharacterized protein (DUF2345 family)
MSLTACQAPIVTEINKLGTEPDSQFDVPKPHRPQEVTFVLTDELTGTPVANQPYRITLPDKRAVEGITNDKGETAVATSEVHGNFRLQLLPRNQNKR